MSSVVHHDFGKQQMESARAYCRLVGIVEAHAAAVLADPMKFLNESQAEVSRLMEIIRSLQDADRHTGALRFGHVGSAIEPPRPHINVTTEEYDRWQAVLTILRSIP